MNVNELSKKYSEEYCIKVELNDHPEVTNYVHLWFMKKGITFHFHYNYSQLIKNIGDSIIELTDLDVQGQDVDENVIEKLDEWVYNCISKEGFNKEYIRKQRKLKLDRIKQ